MNCPCVVVPLFLVYKGAHVITDAQDFFHGKGQMLGKQHHRLLPVPFENRIGVVLPLAFINKRDRGTATIESRVNRMPVLILLANIMEHADDVRRFRASPRQAIDILLIQCYSGWRPQELGLLELKDVDLESWTFQGGMKTDAGENRVVPIHSRIQDLVLKKYREAEAIGSPYLLNWADPNNRNKKNFELTYARYQKAFERIRDELKLNPEHRPHDGRTHFVTMAKRYGVDEYAIKYMVGHKISDITEKVYTRREFTWLREEIEKIK